MIPELESFGLKASIAIDGSLRIYPKSRITPKLRSWIQSNRDAIYRAVIEQNWLENQPYRDKLRRGPPA